ncbi:endonuclease domain-containing protein [Phenylobacterium sp. RIFCSPHIGHO2_01_FULL_69_31]|uniref:endonuclease domain-containing protein n=1 Tax=Phenylobacterium sp. RIFCSPHIGHO2_01_FULL_69_31 TaxID=1801944 RepID=UPI0025D197D0|nr:endonuclease domain-containing protein [Phenylobacterium sp. RIFCSPHIGHO2_01_FULL_69_31]
MQARHDTRDFARTLRRRLSLPEGLLWRAIKGRKAGGFHFRKQHPLGPYVLDFYCHEVRLCVEIDGASHGMGRQARKDERRDGWVAEKGIRTLRIPASCILDDVDDAVQMIVSAAEGDDPGSEWKPPPSPSATPPPKGEELR